MGLGAGVDGFRGVYLGFGFGVSLARWVGCMWVLGGLSLVYAKLLGGFK